MGRFKEGNTEGKGRPKGKPNSKTETWNTFAEYCLDGGLERFKNELDRLEKKDYVTAFLTILEFLKPKLARAVDKDGEDAAIPSKVTIEIIPSGPKISTSEKDVDV